MIVNREKAENLTCIFRDGSGCLAAGCMFWKWADEQNDLGCCGLIHPNLGEEYRVPAGNRKNDSK